MRMILRMKLQKCCPLCGSSLRMDVCNNIHQRLQMRWHGALSFLGSLGNFRGTSGCSWTPQWEKFRGCRRGTSGKFEETRGGSGSSQKLGGVWLPPSDTPNLSPREGSWMSKQQHNSVEWPVSRDVGCDAMRCGARMLDAGKLNLRTTAYGVLSLSSFFGAYLCFLCFVFLLVMFLTLHYFLKVCSSVAAAVPANSSCFSFLYIYICCRVKKLVQDVGVYKLKTGPSCKFKTGPRFFCFPLFSPPIL